MHYFFSFLINLIINIRLILSKCPSTYGPVNIPTTTVYLNSLAYAAGLDYDKDKCLTISSASIPSTITFMGKI